MNYTPQLDENSYDKAANDSIIDNDGWIHKTAANALMIRRGEVQERVWIQAT